MEFIHKLFPFTEFLPSSGFLPYGICYKWDPYVIWLHVISNGLIAVAYCSIPITLVYLVRRRPDLAFRRMFLCFAVFILASGTTNVLDIWNIWHPNYWLTGIAKAGTAFVSVATAIALIPRIPRVLAMPNPNELEQANAALQREMLEHKQTAQRLRRLNYELQQKTSELEQANLELESFSSSVSHDLRAPVRYIDGFVDLLKEDSGPALSPSGQRYLGIVSSSCAIRNASRLRPASARAATRAQAGFGWCSPKRLLRAEYSWVNAALWKRRWNTDRPRSARQHSEA